MPQQHVCAVFAARNPAPLRPGLHDAERFEGDDGVVDMAGPIRLSLSLSPWQVMSVWDFDAAVERRDSTGGTSKRSVLEQAAKLEAWAEPPAAGQAKRQKK